MAPPSSSKEYRKARLKAEKEEWFIPLSARHVEDTESGSDWGISEILTFRAVFMHCRKDYIPKELEDEFFTTAKTTLKNCEDFTRLGQVMNAGVAHLRGLTQRELRHKDYYPYSAFLSALAELSERPPIMTHREGLRGSTRPPVAGPSSSPPGSYEDEDAEMTDIASTPSPPSMPPTFPAPKTPAAPTTATGPATSDPISSDPIPSSELGSSTFGDAADMVRTAEKLANALIVELLQLLTPYVRGRGEDDDMNLEWAMAPDTFAIRLPGQEDSVKSTNDGALVRRRRDAWGNVVRFDKLVYASIEAKNTFHVKFGERFKPDSVYAQELSQILGMIQQRIIIDSKDYFIPLVSATDHYASFLVAKPDAAYLEFLESGDEEGSPFLTVEEYGTYDLRNFKELTHFSALMIAVVEHLKNLGP